MEQKSKKEETELSTEAVQSEIPDDDEFKRVTLAILGRTQKLKELAPKTVRRSIRKELGLGDGTFDMGRLMTERA